VTGYIPRWFIRPQTVTHSSTNLGVYGRESNSLPVDHKSDALTTYTAKLTILLRSRKRTLATNVKILLQIYFSDHTDCVLIFQL